MLFSCVIIIPADVTVVFGGLLLVPFDQSAKPLHVEARPSLIGIGVLILAEMVMPWLAKQKRQLSAATGSAALRADAAKSAVCGYLALIALVGLAVNTIWRAKWADPVAALALLPTNSVSGEGVLDFMFWASKKHRFGWYLEPGYEYNFGRGHEQSLGVSGGLLIAIP